MNIHSTSTRPLVSTAILLILLILPGQAQQHSPQSTPTDSAATTPPANQTPTTPNIIYINTDDWGIGKVPGYATDPATAAYLRLPNLQRLRDQGLTFTNSYAANAVCGPSRNSLLTGRHPGHSAWRANRRQMPEHVLQEFASDPLLGQVAQANGYRTAAYGKITYGGSVTPAMLNEAGWDRWVGYLGHIDCRDFYPQQVWVDGQQQPVPANTDQVLAGTELIPNGPHRRNAPRERSLPEHGGSGIVEGGTFIDDLYIADMQDFMLQSSDQPFFIYFATTIPHGGPPGGMRVPDLRGYQNVPGLTHFERVYLALMAHHDRHIGELLAFLEQHNLSENTLIIWTSDNGDENSYYGHTNTFDGNANFRASKRKLYEGGIRTPQFAYWPGTIPAGTTSAHITSQIDLMPTLVDIGGNQPAAYMDGISLYPTLSNRPAEQAQHPHLYWEFYEAGRQQAVRKDHWKAYINHSSNNAQLELYNLEEDPAEAHNIADQHPQILQQMRTIMQQEHSPHPHYSLPPLPQ